MWKRPAMCVASSIIGLWLGLHIGFHSWYLWYLPPLILVLLTIWTVIEVMLARARQNQQRQP